MIEENEAFEAGLQQNQARLQGIQGVRELYKLMLRVDALEKAEPDDAPKRGRPASK